MLPEQQPYYTLEEYFDLEETAEYKSEYYQGEIFALAGGSANHNRIAGNVFVALSDVLRGKPCEAFIGDLRVWVKMEIRAFENNIHELLTRAVLRGASHLSAGQEAVAVGAISALRDDDLITSTHRGHGHCHAHGDKVAKTPEARQQHFNQMMAEALGRSGGYCKGKGGSMHIADVAHGNLGATGIVGGNIPVATGAALAQKLQGTDRVVLCFFGDGAVNTGNFLQQTEFLWRRDTA